MQISGLQGDLLLLPLLLLYVQDALLQHFQIFDQRLELEICMHQ